MFLPDGTTVGSPAARSAAVELAASGRSITARAPGGREVLVAVQGMPPGTTVVRTYVSDAELSRGVARAWLILGLLGFALLGLSLLVADRLARSLVRSARDLSSVSHGLAAGRLDARAHSSGTPELRDVASALNKERPPTSPDVPAPLPVPLPRDALATCVDALLGNVFAHTPEGTGFAVGLESGEPGVRLTVADDGPGFATADPLARGVSGAGSSGLGLDIVRRTAESCGGSLSIGRSATGGALVILNLPRR